GCVLIIRDITVRKASETTLRISGEKIARLTQLTRHDIGNQVAALIGYLEFLKDDLSGAESERYINESIDIVEKIILYLDFSREYQEIGTYDPVWLSLEQTVVHAMNDISHSDVEIRSEVIPAVIHADRLFVRVIYNLLDNAIRHGEKVTLITIKTVEISDGDLVLIVEDNGVGIGEDEKERIFEYGYGKNTGFGLAFARDIASVTGISLIETGVPKIGAHFELHIPKEGWRHLKG
ncbi:HAMP domain-containing sensor histidine kinase, partial [Methanocalculus sp.]|uniref:sensor histidine kinase n=1 Tax=Methanocalculus sp. TaxID=2004547 RepID=UPI002716A41A